MKLQVEDIAKISEVNIQINGITVIAGENNTGKSTIGKIVFSIFNSLNNIHENILQERRRSIYQRCDSILREYGIFNADVDNRLKTISAYRSVSNKLSQQLINSKSKSKEDISQLINEELRQHQISPQRNMDDTIHTISEKIYTEYIQICNIQEEILEKEIISRYFYAVFSGQVNSLHLTGNNIGNIALYIKERQINLKFTNNVCIKSSIPLEITKKAIYIDNPFILDDLENSMSGAYVDRFLQELILQKREINLANGIIDSVQAKDKLDEIEAILQDVIDGEISAGDAMHLSLDQENLAESLLVDNLSTGLKSFVLLKLLLENKILEQKDILILDEPEIHLHPQWQLKYAQLIILLQKAFDLNIIITTHSAHFLEAIDVYAKIYKSKDICNYYFSHKDTKTRMCTLSNATTDKRQIYGSLIAPNLAIDELKAKYGITDE